MKINAEKFLSEINNINLLENVFLISGNEPGLISGVERKIIDIVSKKNNEAVDLVEINHSEKRELSERLNSSSLFSSYNIITIKSLDKKIIDTIENENIDKNTIIISDSKIKNSSKTKNYFDYHKKFYSVSCYSISKSYKKQIIDLSLTNRSKPLTKNAYWFLIENISNDYQILKNELEKLSLYADQSLEIEDVVKILSDNNKLELDEFFFDSLLSTNEGIIIKSNKAIKSLSDAYIFLQILKNYVKILAITSEEKKVGSVDSLVEKYLPKYLFKQKEKFKALIRKASVKKIIEITNLVFRAEIFLRKNDNQFKIIIQRLVLRCGKILR